jgi:undecaprenyl diphosphate synthase
MPTTVQPIMTHAPLDEATLAPVRPIAVTPPTTARHVAIIMDGNRRWAEQRGLPVALGHKAGAEAVRRTIRAAIEAGVQWLTLYAFSSENWLRPAEEVKALTGLMRFYLRAEVATLAKEGIRLQVIGERERFGAETMREIERAEAQTAAGRRLTLTVCLSYGARSEIAAAARAMARAVQDGRLDPASIDETSLGRFLYTAAMPDPDLIIRTSGEQRLSNFLLWQAAYSEFVFQDVLWPDYGQPHLAEALREYGRRERRYGARAG